MHDQIQMLLAQCISVRAQAQQIEKDGVHPGDKQVVDDIRWDIYLAIAELKIAKNALQNAKPQTMLPKTAEKSH